MNSRLLIPALVLALVSLDRPAFSAVAAPGTVVTEHLDSAALRDNRIGLDPRRSISIYLPPGYATSRAAYPVVYFLHSFFGSDRQFLAESHAQVIFDHAIAAGVIPPLIVVIPDYSSTNAGGFFANSPTSGRWLDYTVGELVPFIDAHYRTRRDRASRGVAGEFIGAYGALKLAMYYPQVFGAVYALHPVGTGTGMGIMADKADWSHIQQAQAWADLKGDGVGQIFLSMAQAFLPDPARPPFYCDLLKDPAAGGMQPNRENIRRLEGRFLLDHLVQGHPELAANLRTLRGLKLDWGRYDANPDHVYANQAFTRDLDELGISHEAEEYGGNGWDHNWIPHGRVADDLLPFFARTLVFQEAAGAAP